MLSPFPITFFFSGSTGPKIITALGVEFGASASLASVTPKTITTLGIEFGDSAYLTATTVYTTFNFLQSDAMDIPVTAVTPVITSTLSAGPTITGDTDASFCSGSTAVYQVTLTISHTDATKLMEMEWKPLSTGIWGSAGTVSAGTTSVTTPSAGGGNVYRLRYINSFTSVPESLWSNEYSAGSILVLFC